MDRKSRLSESSPVELLRRAQRYLEERRAGAQAIGTHNVRYVLTSAGDPAWSGTLPASPVSPSTGMKVLRLTVTAENQTDLFCRVIHRLDVTTDGNWYRPSNELADIKAAQTPYRIRVMPEVSFGLTRNSKTWVITISGVLNAQVYVRLWVAANDHVITSVTEVAI